MKIWIYWSESYSWIYFYIFINKIWKIYWSEQCITGLGPEDRWSSWGLNQRSWAGGPVIIVRTESEVLGRRTGDHREDLIRGLGPEDRWSSCGLNQIVILLVLTIIPATLWSMIHIAWMYFLYFLILALHLSLHRFILNCKDLRG